MRPRLPAMLFAPGGLGHRLALDCSWRYFGLRTLLAVSSVTSGRIEFVSRPALGPLFYGLSVHFQLLSTRVAATQLLSVTGGQLRQRGTLTLLCTFTLKRTCAGVPPSTSSGRGCVCALAAALRPMWSRSPTCWFGSLRLLPNCLLQAVGATPANPDCSSREILNSSMTPNA
jgi:hypothetical protein